MESGKFHVVTGHDLGLAGATKPYPHAIDANLGYAFIEHWFSDVGVGWSCRQVVLSRADTGQDRGSIHDQLLTFDVGLGWEM